MNVALTGATGFIGSHVLTELLTHGHDVTALVRDDAQADAVSARGATPAVVDLYDRPAVVSALRTADGRPRRQPRDATSADLIRPWSMRRSMPSLARGKPYLHQRCVDLRHQPAIQRGSPIQPTRDGRMEATDRASGARCDRHARSRDRVKCRVRRRRRRDSWTPPRLTSRRRGKLDHAWHRATALVDSPRCRSGRLLPPGSGTRLGSWLLRHR